ncbi:UNVERIFIED_ORG: hypothetical protein ABIC62_005746 [Burkholderia sp. 1595]|uniref:Sel1 repeat family protein n=1 Tax=Paraburkholderia terricola TaxID=169427 RepID=A0ABU1LZI7_9BURK|nr:hypothetical protein [Paraburkholderia terricola]MDR6412178.1 hypothetical protein [Paraburkholderia terricola]
MPMELKQPIVQKPPPGGRAKRAQLVAVGMVLGMFLLAIVLMDPNSSVGRWAAHRDAIRQRDAIASVMTPLARAGKPDAVLWYARHYADGIGPLRQLAASGNGEALWTLAGLTWNSDRANAMRLVSEAAREGYPDAVLYEHNHPVAVR